MVGTVTPRVDTSDVQQVNETRRQPVAELETALEYITAMPGLPRLSVAYFDSLIKIQSRFAFIILII